MKRTLFGVGAAVAASLAFVVVAPAGDAAPRSHTTPSSLCTVNPDTVSVGEVHLVTASGLPTGTALNIWVTDADGTDGRPIGTSPDGTLALTQVAMTPGTTTYQFSGPVRGNMKVYATCTVYVLG